MSRAFRRPLVRVAIVVASLVLAACSDSLTDPQRPAEPSERASTATTVAPTIEVWGPANLAVLSGTQYIRATLQGYSVGEYDMYWRVDAGSSYKLYTSYETAPHKEAKLSVTSWTWNGTGHYTIRLRALSKSGVLLAETSRRIFIARPHRNLFPGATFYVDPFSNASRQAEQWETSRPADAALIGKMAARSQADWFGDWTPDVGSAVSARVSAITAAGALPVLVAYNIPVRDCMGYSGGGAAGTQAYLSWVGAFASGIGDRRAVVVLEPDALALTDCLTADGKAKRIEQIRQAIKILKAQPQVSVYVDAGNSGWHAPAVIADRMLQAGLGFADGFSLNVSNFHRTSDNVGYGAEVARLTGGKHFVIDTSRNGIGPTTPYEWCNPSGRALGTAPTASTGHALADAFLWIKRPGESDGTCNGGPSAGGWWAEYALGLAKMAE